MDIDHSLINKIKILDETIWEGKVDAAGVNRWLENFDEGNENDDLEKRNALYLLSRFIYFGSREMREMLVSLFRDLFKYPIVKRIRESNRKTNDLSRINTLFESELSKTRFLGVGNPSESGSHLLYYFRQENCLPKDLFIHTHQIFTGSRASSSYSLRDPNITRFVFIDDFCGSGDQACEYSKDILEDIKGLNSSAEIFYLILFTTYKALERIKSETLFSDVRAVFTLDDSYKVFSDNSRYFPANIDSVEKTFSHKMCTSYGQVICKDNHYMSHYPLGYKDGQLLIGFHHNVPDNTLPIIWSEGSQDKPWYPIFKRYPKIY